jgi:hypothetical protein
MITAGLLLGGIGLADAFRPLVPRARRWIVLAAIGVGVLLVGIATWSMLPAVIALLGGAAWVWLVPLRGRSRAGFWPAVGLAVVCGAALAVGGNPDPTLFGVAWHVHSPVGEIALDQAIVALGAVTFLLESANAVVRVALATEGVSVQEGTDAAAAPGSSLKGGRLIGPIERIIVFSLTLAAAYPLLAAFIAAKGIVRFPEISRDSDNGNRAEYFLIGSLVSWVQALAAAFLVWWAFAAH